MHHLADIYSIAANVKVVKSIKLFDDSFELVPFARILSHRVICCSDNGLVQPTIFFG